MDSQHRTRENGVFGLTAQDARGLLLLERDGVEGSPPRATRLRCCDLVVIVRVHTGRLLARVGRAADLRRARGPRERADDDAPPSHAQRVESVVVIIIFVTRERKRARERETERDTDIDRDTGTDTETRGQIQRDRDTHKDLKT